MHSIILVVWPDEKIIQTNDDNSESINPYNGDWAVKNYLSRRK